MGVSGGGRSHTHVAAARPPAAEKADEADQAEEPASPANQPAALQELVPRTWLLIVARLAKRDAETLTPRQFWLTIAKRGGFIGRKRDGQPGWMTIWRGWYDVMMMVQGAELLSPAPQPRSCG